MTVEQMTARINELYHKSQSEGLSAAEKEEQASLRRAYVANVRANLKGQLDQISIVEKDGSVTNLGEKNRRKQAGNAEEADASAGSAKSAKTADAPVGSNQSAKAADTSAGPAQSSKAGIRARSLEKRDSLSARERASYSEEIVKKITNLSCYQKADALLAYASYRSEADLTELIRQALVEGRPVFLPKVTGKDMEFYRIAELSDLQEGYRGIPEPAAGQSYPQWLSGKESPVRTLMCMPGAAFDQSRHRIGYGGGFYDRYLDRLPGMHAAQRLTTAAAAFSCQVWEEIPWEAHDILPDILVTEREVFGADAG